MERGPRVGNGSADGFIPVAADGGTAASPDSAAGGCDAGTAPPAGWMAVDFGGDGGVKQGLGEGEGEQIALLEAGGARGSGARPGPDRMGAPEGLQPVSGLEFEQHLALPAVLEGEILGLEEAIQRSRRAAMRKRLLSTKQRSK